MNSHHLSPAQRLQLAEQALECLLYMSYVRPDTRDLIESNASSPDEALALILQNIALYN